MFRVVFLTFGGEYRGGSPEMHGGAHPHESPKVMVWPALLTTSSVFDKMMVLRLIWA
jgi:NADH:ubiquinone oxidoreductase subunit 5 (subunit L)/multisubunit Na+/H+ antiporter MnhA subunit